MSNLHENASLSTFAQQLLKKKKLFKLCNFSGKKQVQIFLNDYNR
jgi:hypothetical protein